MVQLKTKITISPSLIKAFNGMKQAKMNSLVRQGLVSGVRPMVQELKKEIRKIRDVSRNSTGATHRAVVSKVQYPSKKIRNHGYAMAGIDWDYTEKHFKTNEYLHRQTGNRKVARRHTGVSNLNRKGTIANIAGRKSNRRIKNRYVTSFQRNALRISRSTGKGANRRPRSPVRDYQKNVPSKYWHLINFGSYNGAFPGYDIIGKAKARSLSKGIKMFEDTIVRGLKTRGLL